MLAWLLLLAQLPQNPSPMVENTRRHERLAQRNPAASVTELSLGRLHIPRRLARKSTLPLIVHFHGAAWLAEQSTDRHAVIALELGAGSGRYAAPFAEEGRFLALLAEAEAKTGKHFQPVILSSFSAGYGAIRQILRHAPERARVSAVVLADSLHAGYGSEPADLDAFLPLAMDAMAGRIRLVVTHSEVFPGTFASTTETADRLLAHLQLRRKAVLKWGPLGMQQLSEVRVGRLRMLGFAGNSAPDHTDHLHAIGRWWKLL